MASKRRALTLEQRIQVLQKIDSGLTNKEIAKQFKIGVTQVHSIKRKRQEVKQQWEEGGRADKKHLKRRKSSLEALNAQLWQWFCDTRSRSLPLTGKLIQEKALVLSIELSVDDFTASNGWLDKWKRTYNVSAAVLSETRRAKVKQSDLTRKQKKECAQHRNQRQEMVIIGRQKERWKLLKLSLSLSSDEALAQTLLDIYEVHVDKCNAEVRRATVELSTTDENDSNLEEDPGYIPSDNELTESLLLKEVKEELPDMPYNQLVDGVQDEQICQKAVKEELTDVPYKQMVDGVLVEQTEVKEKLTDTQFNQMVEGVQVEQKDATERDEGSQTHCLQIEVVREDFPDCDHLHIKKEVDSTQMSADTLCGVDMFYDGIDTERKSNQEKEKTTDWRDTDAIYSQSSPFIEKSLCELCGAEFAQAGSLMVHMSVYHGQDLQTLPTQEYSIKEEIESGINYNNSTKIIVNGRDKPFKCTDCNKSFTCKSVLKIHKCVHNGGKPYQCAECDKSFHESGKLEKHQYLQQHFQSHTREMSYKCTECGKAFRYQKKLNIHLRTHTDVKSYLCTRCGKAFRYKSALNRHKCIHTSEKPYKCTECDKAFRYKDSVKQHVCFHTSDKNYKCTECGRAFRDKSNLNRHLGIHTCEKPYKCTECGKPFRLQKNLTQHLCIHTSEKPHKCSECGKAFRYKSNLNRHLRLHRSEKPYKCTECGKAWREKYNLNRHLCRHSSDKTFTCTECGKAFGYKRNLNRHLSIHTSAQKVARHSETNII